MESSAIASKEEEADASWNRTKMLEEKDFKDPNLGIHIFSIES